MFTVANQGSNYTCPVSINRLLMIIVCSIIKEEREKGAVQIPLALRLHTSLFSINLAENWQEKFAASLDLRQPHRHFLITLRSGAILALLLKPTLYGTFPLLSGE